MRDQARERKEIKAEVSKRIEATENLLSPRKAASRPSDSKQKAESGSTLFSSTVLGRMLAETGMKINGDFEVHSRASNDLVGLTNLGLPRKPILFNNSVCSPGTPQTCTTVISTPEISKQSLVEERSSSPCSFATEFSESPTPVMSEKCDRQERLHKRILVLEERLSSALDLVASVTKELQTLKAEAMSSDTDGLDDSASSLSDSSSSSSSSSSTSSSSSSMSCSSVPDSLNIPPLQKTGLRMRRHSCSHGPPSQPQTSKTISMFKGMSRRQSIV